MPDQKFDQSPDPRIDQPAAVRSGEDLNIANLEPYLRKELPTAAGPLRVEQFPGGMSNLTYLLRLGNRQLVLRRPPFGAAIKSAHDMGREYKILTQLAPVYPKVPRPLLYCQDTDIVGAPFYLMERVQGRILRSSMTPQEIPESATMAKVADALVDALVELHALDYEAAGLADLGRPEGYVERQVTGWSKRYRAARTDDLPDLEKVAEWLRDSPPTECGSALIHNDFKYDNVVLDPQDASHILALLDWEMATLGDPMMDLGTTLAYWTDPGDPPELAALSLSPTLLPGNPTRRQVAERYSLQSGRELGDIVFYYAYGLFKIAVIMQQIYFRYQQGHTQDPRFASLIKGVEVCGRMAAQAIDKKRIDCLFT